MCIYFDVYIYICITKVGDINKIYIESIYKTSDSVANGDFKIEIKEAFDLPDNTTCYIDDISIPHTWYSIGYRNNKL